MGLLTDFEQRVDENSEGMSINTPVVMNRQRCFLEAPVRHRNRSGGSAEFQKTANAENDSGIA